MQFDDDDLQALTTTMVDKIGIVRKFSFMYVSIVYYANYSLDGEQLDIVAYSVNGGMIMRISLYQEKFMYKG